MIWAAYIIALHIISIIGLIVYWDPLLLPLVLIGNILWFGIGDGIFYHRYLTHKNFTCSTPTYYFMVVCSIIAGQGGHLGWAVQHRHHHALSDTDQDPHTPKEEPIGMWFFPHNRRGNILDIEVARDLIDQKELRFLQEYYWYLHFALVGLVCIVSLPIAIYFIFVPLMIQVHQLGLINVLGHSYGYKTFDLPDNSKNSKLTGLLTYGESLQNNHHAQPRNYNYAISPGEIDISAWIIKHFLAKTIDDSSKN
jgi:stearoyl-CoA desaturase (delta-9 desaturase)